MEGPKPQTTKPKTPDHKTNETSTSTSISDSQRTTFSDNSIPVTCRKMEVTVLQDQTALLLQTRTFFFSSGMTGNNVRKEVNPEPASNLNTAAFPGKM
jgi:hypothetical protein